MPALTLLLLFIATLNVCMPHDPNRDPNNMLNFQCRHSRQIAPRLLAYDTFTFSLIAGPYYHIADLQRAFGCLLCVGEVRCLNEP
jgi:hypothetical protein